MTNFYIQVICYMLYSIQIVRSDSMNEIIKDLIKRIEQLEITVRELEEYIKFQETFELEQRERE
jgi:hypothetical protein